MPFTPTCFAVALGLSAAAVPAVGQPQQPPGSLTFVGVAYDFNLARDGFSLSTTVIRFLTKGTLENSDVLNTLHGSYVTGGSIAVEVDPSQGAIDEKSLRAVFPARRILTVHEAINVARGPMPAATPQRTLAEGVALAEAGRGSAALPFLERALADPSLSPRAKSLAYRIRGELRFRSAIGSLQAATPESDLARVGALDDLDRAAALAPDDTETAFERSLVLESLGADEEAVAALRPMSDPARDNQRILLATRWLMHMGKFADALTVWDELAKHPPSNGLGMGYRYGRGQILIGLNRLDEASDEFSLGLRKEDYWPAYLGRACASAKKGRLQEAERDYAKARTLMLAQGSGGLSSRDVQWALQAGPKLESAVASRPNAPDDSPCLPISHRERSLLMPEKASVGAAPAKPAP